jgi:HK97 family phage major capsid protein
MPTELVTKMAAALGVEDNPEAVKAALYKMMEQFQEEGEEEYKAKEGYEGAAKSYREAFDVENDTQLFALLGEMVGIVEQLEPVGLNASAAKAMKADIEAIKNRAPAVKKPFPVASTLSPDEKPSGSRVAASKRYEGYGKTAKYNKPSLIETINDLASPIKAMNYETGQQGGYVLRQEVATEILDALRPALVLEQAGATVYEMGDVATLTLPKMNAVPTAQWLGVNQSPAVSNASLETITLSPKRLSATVDYPAAMLRMGGTGFENKIRDEIVRTLKLAIELAALFGTGTRTGTNQAGEPLGILNTSGVNITTLATNGRKPTLDDLQKAFERIEARNVVRDDSAAYIMRPELSGGFRRMKDTTGQPLLMIDRQGTVKTRSIDGIEVLDTTQIPQTVTVGNTSNNTYVFAGYWRNLWMGYGQSIEMQVITGATDKSLALSANVSIIASVYVDTAVAYPEAFEVLSGVQAL